MRGHQRWMDGKHWLKCIINGGFCSHEHQAEAQVQTVVSERLDVQISFQVESLKLMNEVILYKMFMSKLKKLRDLTKSDFLLNDEIGD